MIIKRAYCDKCGQEMTDMRYERINLTTGESYDLCPRCLDDYYEKMRRLEWAFFKKEGI